MNLDVLKAQLRLHEGVRRFPYLDSVGKWTIGVGHNLSDKGLSPRAIDFLLDEDLDECVIDLATFPWFAPLDEVRQHVLLDLRFNLGPSRFRGFKRMLRAVSEGDYAAAATALRRSLWFSQVKSRGETLVRMMQTGVAG